MWTAAFMQHTGHVENVSRAIVSHQSCNFYMALNILHGIDPCIVFDGPLHSLHRYDKDAGKLYVPPPPLILTVKFVINLLFAFCLPYEIWPARLVSMVAFSTFR